MNKLANWPQERETHGIEVNFVTARAAEKSLDPKNYLVYRGLTTIISDAMFSLKCAEISFESGDAALLMEDTAQLKESVARLQVTALSIPKTNKRLRRKVSQAFSQDILLGIPKLYGMVAEIDSLAVREKRVILEA